MEKFSAQLIAFLSGFDGLTAYATILGVLLVCGLGVPIPEDITLIAAGLLAGLGNISLAGALIVGFVGVLIGDGFLFFIGRLYGRRVFSWPLFKKIFTPERVHMAEKKIRNNQSFICFTARFLPGLRAPIYLTAGVMGVSPWTFILLDGMAALLSVPVWVVGAWYFAANIDEALEYASQIKIYLVFFLAILFSGFLAFKVYQRRRIRRKS
jgi:membrane protein DedA with SNARE-associated domain